MRKVFITGGSGGLGEALATTFAAEGYWVTIAGRREAELRRVAATIPNSNYVVMDVSDARSMGEALSRLQMDDYDYVICNAGISQRSSFVNTDFQVTEQILATNLTGAMRTAYAFLPSFIEDSRRKKHLIFISSIQGYLPLPQRTAYCSSKHGLNGFVESLRFELPAHVCAHLICPGYIRTELDNHAVGGGTRRGARGADPQRVAKQICALCRAPKGANSILAPCGHRLLIYLKFFLPNFYRWLISKFG